MVSICLPDQQNMRPAEHAEFATTNAEFASVIAYLELAIGKAIGGPEHAVARIALYHEALGDVPAAVLAIAAKRVAISHPWSTFPSVAELRQAAVETMAGESTAPPFADAWRAAVEATKRMSTVTDPAYRIIRAGKSMTPIEHNAAIVARLPSIVAKALECFGAGALHEDDICRSQFRRMYEELVEREQKQRLLPAALASRIEAIKKDQKQLPAPVEQLIGTIGHCVSRPPQYRPERLNLPRSGR